MMKRLTFLILATASFFLLTENPLFASVTKPANKIHPTGIERAITYGFYLSGKRADQPTSKSRVFLCLDNQTSTLRCRLFDKKQSLKDFHQLIKTTLERPAFTIEQVPKYYLYGEKWFAERTEDIAPKYNGQELDKESDFYYFNARHYDPELARFVTPDVVVDGEDTTAGWNRYMYVHGNPITYKDPTGHFLDKLVDAAVEFGSRVIDGLSDGKSLSKAIKDVDLKEVVKESSGFNDLKKLASSETSVTEKLGAAASFIPGAKTLKKLGKVGKGIAKLVDKGADAKKTIVSAKGAAKKEFNKQVAGSNLKKKVIRSNRDSAGKIVGVGTQGRNGPTYRPKKDGSYSVGRSGKVKHFRPTSDGGYTINQK